MIIKDEIKNYLIWKGTWSLGKEIAQYINERWDLNIGDIEVRHAIQQLRMEGVIIVAGGKGYLYTKDLETIEKYLKSRWCEVCREMKSFRAMASACNLIDQLTLWEKEAENGKY